MIAVKSILSLVLILVCGTALGQTTTTGNATTTGQCSPAVTGNNNTFNFQYCGKDPEQEKKILEILNAISASDAKLNAVLQAITPPKFKIMSTGPAATPPGAHPRTSVKFFLDGPDERGQIEILCDRACSPIDACRLTGQNTTKLATATGNPNLAEFLFLRQFPPLTQCELTVESRDNDPVKLLTIDFSRRIDDLVPNAVQPSTCVVAGGAAIC